MSTLNAHDMLSWSVEWSLSVYVSVRLSAAERQTSAHLHPVCEASSRLQQFLE